MSVVEISVYVTQNEALSANTPVPNWSSTFTNSHFNLTTGEYTCPMDGLYSINGTVRTSNSTPQVYKNGALLGCLNTTYSLVAGDTIDIRFPVQVVVIGGGATPNSFLNIKYYTDQTMLSESFSLFLNQPNNYNYGITGAFFGMTGFSYTLPSSFTGCDSSAFYNNLTYGTLDPLNGNFTVGITGIYEYNIYNMNQTVGLNMFFRNNTTNKYFGYTYGVQGGGSNIYTNNDIRTIKLNSGDVIQIMGYTAFSSVPLSTINLVSIDYFYPPFTVGFTLKQAII